MRAGRQSPGWVLVLGLLAMETARAQAPEATLGDATVPACGPASAGAEGPTLLEAPPPTCRLRGVLSREPAHAGAGGEPGAGPLLVELNTRRIELNWLERGLFVGVTLDVLAAGFGAFLWERGRRIDSGQLTGWGRSLMLQGALILLFDSGLLLRNARYDTRLMLLLSTDARDGAGLAVWMRF